MDVCPRVSVLCCPVSVEALRRADPPAKESYQLSLYVDREAHEGRPTVREGLQVPLKKLGIVCLFSCIVN
jgi:hypothetical protein